MGSQCCNIKKITEFSDWKTLLCLKRLLLLKERLGKWMYRIWMIQLLTMKHFLNHIMMKQCRIKIRLINKIEFSIINTIGEIIIILGLFVRDMCVISINDLFSDI